jgi:hypothetical protein
MNATRFPWYVIHKDTKHVIAGFGEHDDAERFCGMFNHGMYVVRDAASIAA